MGVAKLLDGKFARLDIGQVFIDEKRRQGVPPGVIFLLETGHDLGVIGGDILRLAAVGKDIVELVAVHQAPAVGPHGAVGAFGFFPPAGIPAPNMGEERAVGPSGLGIFEKGNQRAPAGLEG